MELLVIAYLNCEMPNEFFVNSINEFMLVAVIIIITVKGVEVFIGHFGGFDANFTPSFKVIPASPMDNCPPHHLIQEVYILIELICPLVPETVLYSIDPLQISNLEASLIL